ncbi:DsbA family protein, partial [Candidatus Gottesmanbacteria bacterium]|nr:DsbA family protein [Candidatus Gottesmanbacteria bacterium]
KADAGKNTANQGVTVAPTQPTLADIPKISDQDHVRGDRNSRIALIEYSDLECPFCKKFHPTAQQALDTYKGQLMWVYRHFPLAFHQNAHKESEASECVASLGGNDAFWKYIDAIYERTTANGTGFALDKLAPLAAEVGVNQAKFTDCFDKGTFVKKVDDEISAGSQAGINGTPGNILMDTKTGKTVVIPGAVPFEQLKSGIDSLLKS